LGPRINTAAGGALALLAYWIWRLGTELKYPTDLRNAGLVTGIFHSLSETYMRDERTAQAERDRTRLRDAWRDEPGASIERLAAEPGTTAEEINQLNALLASSHRFDALMALDAAG